MSGLPTNSTCMLLSPTQLWGNNMVDFLSDPDIPETILGDSSNPTVRGFLTCNYFRSVTIMIIRLHSKVKYKKQTF